MLKTTPIICLMGPTAAGKTQLAIDLLPYFPFEIISVDSAMIYRGMDIGTAKPTADILRIAPHRLIDIRDPADAYSAAQFQQDAWREIQDILSHGKIPLLVGGTMLYFHVLQAGLSNLPSADEKLRESITAEAEEKSWPVLHARLQAVDPIAAARIHPHDSQRIQRALEVYLLTGKNLSMWQQDKKLLLENPIYNIAIFPGERAVLHDRITERFHQMLKKGFLEEVRQLFDRGDLHLGTPAIRSVGYRQAWEYFLGNLTADEMREKSIIATRQLAKRQLTWLRHWPFPIQSWDAEDKKIVEKISRVIDKNLSF